MLTGDKVETGICIARSTRLVDRSQRIFHLSGTTHTDLSNQFDLFSNSAYEAAQGIAMVLDGSTLAACLTELPDRFVAETNKCTSVVICRCSPTQKAEVVNLVRKYNPTR